MVYDQLEAEQFIARQSGLSADNVRRFLTTLWEWQESREGGQEDQSEALNHVVAMTQFSRTDVASMYAEDVAYMITQGIMEEGAYPYFRSWADAIAEEEKEAEDAIPVN